MKKALLASSALLLTAGVAAAEVTFSGSARMGLEYVSPDVGDSETRLDTRLRFNIDASKETDAGVKFGGRIRLQYDDGTGYVGGIDNTGADPVLENGGGARLNAAYVYAEAQGFRVEVGNANTAIDSAGLMYAAEVGTGYYGNSSSYEFTNFYGYSSGPYGAAESDRMGVYTQYETGPFVARLSWITPDQGTGADVSEELSVSLDYATGPFAVSFAYASNGAGVDGNDQLFLGGQYTINDAYNVGLLYNDASAEGTGGLGDTSVITLYGNATFGATTVQAYIATVSADTDPEEDLAYGLGANYDLGGASLGGAIEGNFAGDTIARIGVGFSF